MAHLLEERIKLQDENTMSALILLDYYEIIKNLISALMILHGLKAENHVERITFLSTTYPDTFTEADIVFLHNLRMLRHRILYEGFQTPAHALHLSEATLQSIITKLRTLLSTHLE